MLKWWLLLCERYYCYWWYNVLLSIDIMYQYSWPIGITFIVLILRPLLYCIPVPFYYWDDQLCSIIYCILILCAYCIIIIVPDELLFPMTNCIVRNGADMTRWPCVLLTIGSVYCWNSVDDWWNSIIYSGIMWRTWRSGIVAVTDTYSVVVLAYCGQWPLFILVLTIIPCWLTDPVWRAMWAYYWWHSGLGYSEFGPYNYVIIDVLGVWWNTNDNDDSRIGLLAILIPTGYWCVDEIPLLLCDQYCDVTIGVIRIIDPSSIPVMMILLWPVDWWHWLSILVWSNYHGWPIQYCIIILL